MVTLISCPACAHQCSEEAPTCPNCGHPIKQKPKSQFQQDIEDIKKVFSWIGLGLLLPTIAAPTLIVSVLEPNKPNEPAAQAIWNVCVLTAPLTFGLFLIGALAITFRDRLPEWASSWGGFVTILGSVAAILIGSAWIVEKVFNINDVDVNFLQNSHPFHSIQIPEFLNNTYPGYVIKILVLIWYMLREYWNLYGPLKFFSSLLVAGLLVWIWTQKLWLHVKDASTRLVKRLLELVKRWLS